jgi:HEAT repeat protein
LSNKPPPDLDSRRPARPRGSRPTGSGARLAAKLERTLATALEGDPRVVINVKASELLDDAELVAEVITRAFHRAGAALGPQLTVIRTFRRSGVEPELLDSLVSPDPDVRIAGARLCGALRLPDAVPWLIDLLDDPHPGVREIAVRALGQAGGRRAVAALLERAGSLPRYRVSKALAMAASDIDLDSLLREPGPTSLKVTILMACGMRRDALMTPLLVRMALDRKCETDIRVAACRALGMIGDPAGADAMRLLASEPDPVVHKSSVRTRVRISAAMRRESE